MNPEAILNLFLKGTESSNGDFTSIISGIIVFVVTIVLAFFFGSKFKQGEVTSEAKEVIEKSEAKDKDKDEAIQIAEEQIKENEALLTEKKEDDNIIKESEELLDKIKDML